MDVKGFLSVDILRVIRKLSIKTFRYVWSNVDIPNEVSCHVEVVVGIYYEGKTKE